MKSYIPDHPRPQLTRPAWQSLNGDWDFVFDDGDRGLKDGFAQGFTGGRSIRVPFTYETSLSGIGDETMHEILWYSRSVPILAEALSGRVVLHLEGSDYHTDVWVGGNHAGSHDGGYARFSMDITPYVQAGDNLLVIRVQDRCDPAQVRGKQRWLKDSFGCWYIQSTGIWKTVWLEFLPQSYIKNIRLTPDLGRKCLDISAEIAGPADGLTLRAAAAFEGVTAGVCVSDVRNGRAELSVALYNTDIDPWGVKTWTPEHPFLYDLELTLAADGSAADRALSYFGMREVEIKGDRVLLNGAPLYQRLILDQGYWEASHLTPPDEAALREDIEKTRALGYNGLRKHQKTEDERFLYWCDVEGMLVWCEMPSFYAYNDGAVTAFLREWTEVVRQNYSHPCVITWTPLNESWGMPNVRRSRTEQHFSEAVYHATKMLDPMRPVIVNDGWEHTVSDILTLHDYQPSGERLYAKYTAYKDGILNGTVPHQRNRFALAEGFLYKGQPVIISEYGGIAFLDEKGWGYGEQVSTTEAFMERFEAITDAVMRLPYVCGFCYTQLTDVQHEVNGLLDGARHFKLPPEDIRRINERRDNY